MSNRPVSNAFIIEDYNHKPAFSSFLPGIGGKYGIPLWAFYTNRGQGLCSLGFMDKDNALMEFLPANQAYQLTNHQGFRTFLNIKNKKGQYQYEPFQYVAKKERKNVSQKMAVTMDRFQMTDYHKNYGVQTEIEYFPIINESFGAMVRKVTIKNNSAIDQKIRFLDGLATLIPAGIDDESLKFRRYLMKAFIESNWKENSPLFRIKQVQQDTSEVEVVSHWHYVSCLKYGKNGGESITPLINPEKIFDQKTDFSNPELFYQSPTLLPVIKEKLATNYPCAFYQADINLQPDDSETWYMILGRVEKSDYIKSILSKISRPGFLEEKSKEVKRFIHEISVPSLTVSNHHSFNQYCLQNFMDNVLRGGYPIDVKKKTLYCLHRKHGDLERDYNSFNINPTFLSQGTANYRDINQNRRYDNSFFPYVKNFNVVKFINLLQLDGFNPLLVKDYHYRLSKNNAKKIVGKYVKVTEQKNIEELLKRPFLPGPLMTVLMKEGFIRENKADTILEEIMSVSEIEECSEHGEGYWTDHWSYNLDLLESFSAIYPDEFESLVWDKELFWFYDSAYVVKPRKEKYRNEPNGWRQYDAVRKDRQKDIMIKERKDNCHVVREKHGRGHIYQTTMIVKLVSLLLNKLASLDPMGMGIEMESDKPNWYDALNGLPGLIGSSLSETFELKRLILFLKESLEMKCGPKRDLRLPIEMYVFYTKLNRLLRTSKLSAGNNQSALCFWNQATEAKEKYRTETVYGISGEYKNITLRALDEFLDFALKKLNAGINKSWDSQSGVYPSYFYYTIDSRKKLKFKQLDKKGNIFKQTILPIFLEGNVHALRTFENKEKAKQLVGNIKRSKLYDTELGMYKVNASLDDQSQEIGRTRAFTPGWLENESIWLHMEYKYLLELLRNQLYDEYFDSIKTILVPFMLPHIYGRSIYENSSFIVSSSFPDKERWGKGYYARLSGATAEFINMWLWLCAGKKPFVLNEKGELCFKLSPTLTADFFTTKPEDIDYIIDGKTFKLEVPKNSFAFMLLGKTMVVYHNQNRKATFGKSSASIRAMVLKPFIGNPITIEGDTIVGSIAEDVRKQLFQEIEVLMG